MGLVERVRDLNRDRQRVLDRQRLCLEPAARSLTASAIGQRLAFEILQHEVVDGRLP